MGTWTPTNMAWLAGIIEGEGCLHFTKRGHALIRVRMTDEDVVRRLQAVTGFGRVYGPIKKQKDHHKPAFEWTVFIAKHVYAICVAIYQFLGERRGKKAIEIIKWFASTPPKLGDICGTVTKYRNHDCRCDKCRKANRDYARKFRARKLSGGFQ